jgi:hypothetical protein
MKEQDIVDYLCDGYIVYASSAVCQLVDRSEPFGKGNRPAIPLDRKLVKRMVDRGQLGTLNEEGYPPISERKVGRGFKSGWREMGLPEPEFGGDYYLMVQ